MSQEEFILKCKEKYGDDFDYSLISYKDRNSKIKVICNTCGGVFDIRPDHFLYDKKAGCCPLCRYEKLRKSLALDKNLFVKKSIAVHGEKYDYSNLEYVNMHTPVKIVCPTHGEYFKTPLEHLKGCGCPQCQPLVKIDTNMFIKISQNIHGNIYDYSKSIYTKARDKVCITCPIHGDFLQQASLHMHGAGCPHCKKSFGEDRVRKYLKSKNVRYIEQYKILNDNSICKNKHFYVDFFIPDVNLVIEYNGQQHYRKTGFGNGDIKLAKTQARDNSLRKYCNTHNIRLIEIPYWDYKNIEVVLDKELCIK